VNAETTAARRSSYSGVERGADGEQGVLRPARSGKAHCTSTFHFLEKIMYTKPQVVKFGTLRELTQIGLDADCDGGIFGVVNGSTLGCSRTS